MTVFVENRPQSFLSGTVQWCAEVRRKWKAMKNIWHYTEEEWSPQISRQSALQSWMPAKPIVVGDR